MDNPVLVDVNQTFQSTVDQPLDILLREEKLVWLSLHLFFAFREHLLEVVGLVKVLHHDVDVPLVLIGLNELDYMRVVQFGQDLDLPSHSVQLTLSHL